MCGITGLLALEGTLDPLVKRSIEGMTDSLWHRGPDGDGLFSDPFVALGHRRLAIVDRAGGRQPMSNEDGSCQIVFNGEVYNHRRLRTELTQLGHRFRTASDTEAIVHAYEEWGTGCVDRLEGMFAFAIYDRRTRGIFIARDRLGKKPLFYAVLGGVLHFASEIKAFYQSPLWDDALDLSAIEGYLSLGYFLAPDTVYRHVRKLEPGHWLRVADGRLTTKQYWDVEHFDDDARPPVEIAEELESLLYEAVNERLESEVPLGAFLSGGIDSGLVVSFMAQAAAREQLITTTVGFGEEGHNELDAAASTARRFETTHYAEVVIPQLDDVLDRIVAGFDEPFADSSAVPTFYVSGMARKHVTVALSGDGGDESFAGYDFRYVPHLLETRARRLVRGPLARRAAGRIGAHWPGGPRVPRPLRIGTLLQNLSRDPASAYYFDLCFMKPGEARLLLGADPDADLSDSSVYEAVTAPYRRCTSTSALQRAEYADLKIYLPNDVLVKVDRMSMAHSLEVRCPLLDRRVVEFAFRVPETVKMPGLRAKHLLKQIAVRRLPPDVASLPKRGFTAPVGEWVRGTYSERFRSDVLSRGALVTGIVDGSRVHRLFQDHTEGRADHSYALWALWMFERWAQQAKNRSINARAQTLVPEIVQ